VSAGFRSRWLGWTPKSSEMTPTPTPTKPTEAPFGSFGGSHPTRILKPAPPTCPSCGGPVEEDPGDVLCGACYAARRGPGEVLAFDPDRRSRTLARLADRPCPDCQAVTWHVNGRGDATCQTCARRRAGFDEMSAREARP
jgi:hypothetical protein